MGAAGHHYCLRLSVPEAAEDALVAELWAWGTTGVELQPVAGGGLEAAAYFRRPPPGDWRYRLREVVGAAAAAAVVSRQPDRDWMAAYRRSARPLAVGRRLLVDPGEPEPGEPEPGEPRACESGRREATGVQAAASADADGATRLRAAGFEDARVEVDGLEEEARRQGRRLLRLPARTAFGTGSHESTRLTIELLDELVDELGLVGKRVLDVGTGSGILAFAALLAGAGRVLGIDVDPAAVLTAGQNRRLNRLWPNLAAGSLAALRPLPVFDLALVNVRPVELGDDLTGLRFMLRPRGIAIFSGLLGAERESGARRLERHGFHCRRWREAGEWAAVLAVVEAA